MSMLNGGNMNFNIILMAVFLVFTIGCAIRALLSPVAKNIRRLVAVPLSFLICYLLQSHGLFDALGNAVEGMLMDNEMLAALLEASPYLDKLIVGTVSGIASSLLFPIVFVLVYLVIRGLLKAFFDRLLLRLLDRQTKNKVIISLRRVGSLLLGVLETFVSGYVSSSLRDFFSFALLIVLLLVKPSGLFGVDVQDKA